MNEVIRSIKWRKLILVSVLIGGLLGIFDSSLFNRTVLGNPGGCPENFFCKANGCTSAVGGLKCAYSDPYGYGCPTHIDCPNLVE